MLQDLVSGASDDEKRQQWLSGRQVIDVVEAAAGPINPQDLVGHLRPLQPRLYSISSSLKAHPDQVHLTVGAVRYQTHDKPRAGVASTFLADRAGVGNTVGIYLQHSPHFKLPTDPQVPILMIGPGTGIAPFRSFLHERAQQAASGETIGESWLFFGDQHEHCDFLYQEEIAQMQADGVLTKLSTAFSRDQAEKITSKIARSNPVPKSGNYSNKAAVSTSAATPVAWPKTSTKPSVLLSRSTKPTATPRPQTPS